MLMTLGRGTAPAMSGHIIDPSPKTVALFGDSISAQNTNPSGSYMYHEANGYMIALNYLMNSRFHFEHSLNKGVSGNTTADMEARLSDLNGLNADIVIVLGGVNDITGGRTPTQIQTSLSNIYSYINNTLGTKVIAMTILPRSGISSSQKNDIKTVNNWIRNQASKDIVIADAYYLFADDSDEPKTGYTLDTTHPSPIGAFVIAQELKNILQPLYGTPLPFNGTEVGNIITNGGFSGTGGTVGSNVTGQIADSWIVYGHENGTRTVSKNSDGSQKISISIPAGNNVDEDFYLRWPNVNSGYAQGDTVFAEIDLEVINGSNVYFISLDMRDVGSTTHIYRAMDKRDVDNPMPLGSMGRGIIKSPEFVVQSGNTHLEFRMRLEMDCTTLPSSLELNLYGARIIKK